MTAREDTTDLIEPLLERLRSGDLPGFAATAGELEPADLSDVLMALEPDERLTAVRLLPTELSAKALFEMPDATGAEETLAALDPAQAMALLDALNDDEAADLLGPMEPGLRLRLLGGLRNRGEVERLLRYDEETAGGIMTGQVVTVLDTDTVAQALERIRRQVERTEDFYQIFITDRARKLVGVLPLKDLVISPPGRPVRDFMEEADPHVPADMDQEEVARLLSRYNVPSVPVVDGDGRLIGRVTFDDVSDVQEAEATEDLLKFGGLSGDEDLSAGWTVSARSRLPWLVLNLVTAFMAGAVVLMFQGTVNRVVILSAWMPVIAGMGGNAGTQALAVTVRRLAVGAIPPGQFLRVIGKESIVGIMNGLAIGILVAGVAALLGGHPRLGLVVFLAMSGNLFVAGFAGAFIPMLLEHRGVDPAVASSIFVTTFTDICGFTLLLGLAHLLLGG